jgi:hypothetical protein
MSSPAAVRSISSTTSNTRLHGRWPVLARIAWIVVAMSALTVVLVGFVEPQAFCGKVPCSVFGHFDSGNLVYDLIFSVFPTVVWIVIGGLLFLRKSDDWMVCLVSLAFITAGVCTLTDNLIFYANEQQINGPLLWQFAPLSLYMLKSELTLLAIALLPNGQFVPGWARWVLLIYPIYTIVYLVLPVMHLPGWTIFNNPVNAILWFGSEGCLVIMQIYRYARRSGPVVRQQIKWILFSLIVLILADFLITAITNILAIPLLYTIGIGLFNDIILVLPISLTIALLRYHLWEIDIIINRTLVYGSLTALLALVYTGLVIGLQFLLSSFTKGPSEVAIVGSTLAIAALFQPLRKGLQAFIDRRFYRQKYNAAKILATFSTSLREEVDLIQLHEHLVAVVEESMQPTHVSLWLRTERGKKTQGNLDQYSS